MYYIVKGDLPKAKDYMDKLIGMWNGYGFMGYKGYRRYYAFNLALAYFAYRVLKKVEPDRSKEYGKVMEEVKEVAFSLLGEGICSVYEVRDGEVKPIGPLTVFSTSLFVLAFYSPLPEIVAEGRDFLTFIRDKLSEELGPPILGTHSTWFKAYCYCSSCN